MQGRRKTGSSLQRSKPESHDVSHSAGGLKGRVELDSAVRPMTKHHGVRAPSAVADSSVTKPTGSHTGWALQQPLVEDDMGGEELPECLSPEKCPSPLQLTPRQSTVGHQTSFDDRRLDQISDNRAQQHQYYNASDMMLRMPHHQPPIAQQYSSMPGPLQEHNQQLQEQHCNPAASSPFPSIADIIGSTMNCSMQCEPDLAASQDDMLMDFWALLQQTQQNLQDMLVDLETAKIELDLANGRAEEAEHTANGHKVELAAAQRRNAALEGQVQHLQAKEADSAIRITNLTQRNTELATEVQQAQRTAATLELKLERLQLQLTAAQKDSATATAKLAAAATAAASAPAVAAAQEAAAAAAQAVVTQLKSELSQTRSELATTQSRAARAELELAVAKTRALVAQQESSAATDRCQKLESKITSLNQQLGAAAATADVAAADKQKLEQRVELLTAKLEQKESRIRSSMSAMARASTSLRASFSTQGGLLDAGMLRRSANFAADIARKSADIKSLLRASQQQLHQQQLNQRQQQQARYEAADDGLVCRTSSEDSNLSGLLTPEPCPAAPEGTVPIAAAAAAAAKSNHSGGSDNSLLHTDTEQAGVQPDKQVISSNGNSSPFAAAQAQSSSSCEEREGTALPTSAKMVGQHRQQGTNGQQEQGQPVQLGFDAESDAGVSPVTKKPAAQRDPSTGGSAAVDRQSPIFKKRASAGGRRSGGGSSLGGASRGSSSNGASSQCTMGSSSLASAAAALAPAAAAAARTPSAATSLTPRGSLGRSPGLPPRPWRTSSSGLSTSGKSPVGSPRTAPGFSLSPAGSCTPNLMSLSSSRRSSSNGLAQMPCGVLYVPSRSKPNSRRCSRSNFAVGCGFGGCDVCSHECSIAAGAAAAAAKLAAAAAGAGAAACAAAESQQHNCVTASCDTDTPQPAAEHQDVDPAEISSSSADAPLKSSITPPAAIADVPIATQPMAEQQCRDGDNALASHSAAALNCSNTAAAEAGPAQGDMQTAVNRVLPPGNSGDLQQEAAEVVAAATVNQQQQPPATMPAAAAAASHAGEQVIQHTAQSPATAAGHHMLPTLDMTAAAAAAKAAAPLSPLTSPPRSPRTNRQACRITQFAALAPSSASGTSSCSIIGSVSAAVAAWESQAALAAEAVAPGKKASTAAAEASADNSVTQQNGESEFHLESFAEVQEEETAAGATVTAEATEAVVEQPKPAPGSEAVEMPAASTSLAQAALAVVAGEATPPVDVLADSAAASSLPSAEVSALSVDARGMSPPDSRQLSAGGVSTLVATSPVAAGRCGDAGRINAVELLLQTAGSDVLVELNMLHTMTGESRSDTADGIADHSKSCSITDTMSDATVQDDAASSAVPEHTSPASSLESRSVSQGLGPDVQRLLLAALLPAGSVVLGTVLGSLGVLQRQRSRKAERKGQGLRV